MNIPTIHVIFTEDGLPRWFGPEPVRGSEPFDLNELRQVLPADAPEDALAVTWFNILVTHRRVGGIWMVREVLAPKDEEPGAQDAGAFGGAADVDIETDFRG